MADRRNSSEQDCDEGTTPPEAVAGGSQWHPLTTAAMIGGAIAATAGAYLGTRALARRHSGKDGKPVNSVMAAAMTACDVAHKTRGPAPSAADIVVDGEPKPAPVEPDTSA